MNWWPDTDKVTLGYLPTYQRIATELGPRATVCEVGVHQGESLRLWQLLFPLGDVVGVDISSVATWPEGTRRVVSDQVAEDLPSTLLALNHGERFDLIVEDASHDGDASRRTWELLWPLVRPGGYYVIEDWQVGFESWDAARFPRQPSMLATAKGLLYTLDSADGEVESITYRFGQIILKKCAPKGEPA